MKKKKKKEIGGTDWIIASVQLYDMEDEPKETLVTICPTYVKLPYNFDTNPFLTEEEYEDLVECEGFSRPYEELEFWKKQLGKTFNDRGIFLGWEKTPYGVEPIFDTDKLKKMLSKNTKHKSK